MKQLLLFGAAFLATTGLIMLLRPLARRVGLVDRPGGRKLHQGDIPLVGGICIFLSFFLLILLIDQSLAGWRALFFASALVFIVGILDDFRETSAHVRFMVQILAILIVVLWGGLKLTNLGDLLGFGPVLLTSLAIPFTILGGVGVMNAVNMIDGLDGLAGGLLLIFFVCLWGVVLQGELTPDISVLGIVCGALLAFLLFNMRIFGRSRASVFLGDAGSLFLGLLATWFLIRLTQEPHQYIRPITAVWLLALPIMDTVAIMIRRILHGRSPFAPDREHFHHALLVAGFSVRTTVFIILAAHALLAFVGIVGEWLKIPEYIMFYAFLALFGLYLWGINRAWKVMKALRRVHDFELKLGKRRSKAHV